MYLYILSTNQQAFWYYAMVQFGTVKSHPIAQFMKNRIIQEKLHNFKQDKPLVNALSGKILHLHIVSRWFAFEKALKTFYKLQFQKQLNFKAFLRCPRTCTSFHSQRIAYWCNTNNAFLCLGQSEVLVLSTTMFQANCLFWWQKVTSFVEFETN